MNKLNEEELKQLNGGISTWGAIGIGVLVAFLAGVVDGVARPSRCN